VGATGPTFGANFDGIPSYSNVGRSGVDVFAPGGGDAFVDEDGNLLNPGDLILGACSPSIDAFACSPFDYLIGNGTSFAAPHASGEGAVIESNFPRDQRGDLLSACITLSADKVTGRFSDPIFAFGRINVLKGAFCRPSFPLAKH
jgi:subtilisin family serine protease